MHRPGMMFPILMTLPCYYDTYVVRVVGDIDRTIAFGPEPVSCGSSGQLASARSNAESMSRWHSLSQVDGSNPGCLNASNIICRAVPKRYRARGTGVVELAVAIREEVIKKAGERCWCRPSWRRSLAGTPPCVPWLHQHRVYRKSSDGPLHKLGIVSF